MKFVGRWTEAEKQIIIETLKGRNTSDNSWISHKAPSGQLFTAWRSTRAGRNMHETIVANTVQELAEKIAWYYRD